MSSSFRITNIAADPSGRESLFFWGRWQGSALIKYAPLDLPTWDMDAVDSIEVPLNENATNKVQATLYVIAGIVIYDDTGRPHFADLVANGIEDCYITANLDGVVINRVAGGAFDSTSYNSTASSRGKILLGYLT